MRTPSLDARLRREAGVLARLEHPGIVPVHDTGTLADGRAFYAMKLVRGEQLLEHLAGVERLDERLRVFERICETVAFAHARGVLHRDLKPSNVMVGGFGEVLVLDWGLSKVGGRHSGEDPDDRAAAPTLQPGQLRGEHPTDAGTVAGTPGFMAPEQRDGGTVDERSDVYSLGRAARDRADRLDDRGTWYQCRHAARPRDRPAPAGHLRACPVGPTGGSLCRRRRNRR